MVCSTWETEFEDILVYPKKPCLENSQPPPPPYPHLPKNGRKEGRKSYMNLYMVAHPFNKCISKEVGGGGLYSKTIKKYISKGDQIWRTVNLSRNSLTFSCSRIALEVKYLSYLDILFQGFIPSVFIVLEVQLHIYVFDRPFGFCALESVMQTTFFLSQTCARQFRRLCWLCMSDGNVVRIRKCHVLGHIFL